jgi:hypothetical protein
MLAFFSLLWFILIQAEYEMVTKPDLQKEFPGVQGTGAVYLLGFIIFAITAVSIVLFFSIIRSRKRSETI